MDTVAADAQDARLQMTTVPTPFPTLIFFDPFSLLTASSSGKSPGRRAQVVAFWLRLGEKVFDFSSNNVIIVA